MQRRTVTPFWQAVWRWSCLLLIPVTVTYITHGFVKPANKAPVELRQMRSVPPETVGAFNKKYNLSTLKNPVRQEILERMAMDDGAGWKMYDEAVAAGRDAYFQSCFYCHGSLLDGQGHHAHGLNPMPINFLNPTGISQLQESFLFWRIVAGDHGLPTESAPWESTMPAWHEILKEKDVWNVIIFIFDYSGQVPQIPDLEVFKVVTSIKDEVLAKRKGIKGKALYKLRCEVCHGEQGMGDGIAAELMYPKPRDFTLALFKYKTSPGTDPPKDDDLFSTIKYGLPGTAMSGWGINGQALLSNEQIRSLIPVIKSFDITATWAPEDAEEEAFDEDGRYTRADFRVTTSDEPVAGQIAYSPESVEKGREAFEPCEECHGSTGRGNTAPGKRLGDDWDERLWSRDLTKPWTWRATQASANDEARRDQTIKMIYRRLSIGIPGTPMPAHRATEEGNKDPISLEDRWHIANYVYSLRETTVQPVDGSVVIGVKVDGDVPNSVDDEAWDQAKPITLHLVPNLIKDERLFTPLNDAITVRTLYNGEEIAFLLEVNDRTYSRLGDTDVSDLVGEDLGLYSDAFAIQFPHNDSYSIAPVTDKPLYQHGDVRHKTTIWYWNAGAVKPARPPSSMLMDGSGLNNKLAYREKDQSLVAEGEWQDGRWRVLMKHKRIPGNGDMVFDEGRFIPISFANWDGSNDEVRSKHTFSTWHWLMLPPEVDLVKVYGLPLFVGFLFFIAGLVTVRVQRKKCPNH
ncbi:hypothetical protein MNBD_GAMMA26-1958 [hydrothermal vent metagenome]|uniref:Cytochrome c domain-containing protein n=1 Tax=hydrothermal vent metagenome TaxID=652676 RepID=A0A3B1B4S8_9ZZZZ